MQVLACHASIPGAGGLPNIVALKVNDNSESQDTIAEKSQSEDVAQQLQQKENVIFSFADLLKR